MSIGNNFYRHAPLAQLVEQLTLNQWVQGSSPWRCTTYSSIAQSVERMTVNHDVTGSSPVRGAIKKRHRNYAVFFLCFFVCIHLWARTNSATSLTDHCSLRELTVKGRLGMIFHLITLVALLINNFSSLRPIPKAVCMMSLVRAQFGEP